jgi:alanine-glyoxylate transaminase / serine-glyoxylate transaminase / serine-pyruvate transaminase
MELPKDLHIQGISSFQPPKRRLMGPGPSDIHPQVLEALSRPTVGHLDPTFVAMMDEVKSLVQYAYQTTNPLSMVVSAPGSAGMETCFVNLVEPGDKVIVCRNGVFGGRMLENVTRCGGTPVPLDFEWGQPVDPNRVEEALKEHPEATILAFVHAETSTGVRSDAQTLCGLAKQYGCLSIVDAVTSLGGIPVLVDDWGIDAIYSGSQKCLSATPGLSPVTFSKRAVRKINKRESTVQSWFLDLNLVMQYWGSGGGKRSYHHTAPVHALYCMHEALLMLQEEGLDSSWERHRTQHERLRDGLEELGFRFLVDAEYRLPQLNAVFLPEGTEEVGLRQKILQEYSLEVGGGLGDLAGKIWRIGLMGHTAQPDKVDFLLDVLRKEL